MQDYIFNSRRQARRRRRRMVIRLILLMLLVGVGVLVASRWGDFSFSDAPSAPREERDLLPLPPIEETRPVSRVTPPPHAPRLTETPAAQIPGAESEQTTEEETPPAPSTAAIAEETEQSTLPPSPQAPDWTEHLIEKGDTLASIFQELGLSANLLHRIVTSSETAAKLARIRPGQKLRLALTEEGELTAIELQQDRINKLVVRREGDDFVAKTEQLPVETRQAVTEGVIRSSLFVDGQEAGLSDGQIMELVKIFGWEIDFALELRQGDQFRVIYEERYLNGEKLGNGPILAAEFVNQGKLYRAVRYTDSSGDTAYYDADGHIKKRAFLRTPVKFTRISSGFTRKRWHPILKKWRSHKGVDYAAPIGTPVKAAGNGRVTFIGRKGGYGKVIFLRHGGRYTTVYGHLSRFAKGLKTGSKVKQGQIIGYVGKTGLASGPHLHYEFRINGVHRNPLTVKLPKASQLPKKELQRFRRQIQPLLAQLDELRAKSMVAAADPR